MTLRIPSVNHDLRGAAVLIIVQTTRQHVAQISCWNSFHVTITQKVKVFSDFSSNMIINGVGILMHVSYRF